jgi:hypothetical protein
MNGKNEIVLTGKRGGIVLAKEGGRYPKRVRMIWDGDTGLPGALELGRRATTEDVVRALVDNGIPTRGVEGGEFVGGALTQRFKIMPGSSESTVRLLPWDTEVERRLSIISVQDNSVVVEPKGGMPDDKMLCLAATGLFGRKQVAVCQEGNYNEGDVLVLRPDPDISGVVRVISKRPGVL